MRIGVPKEIKVHEYRVGLTPLSVAELVAHGHELFVETKGGQGIDCPDSAYEKAGAKILPDAKSVFDTAEMIVKVKEPQQPEIAMLRPGQILFTYLHLAADKEQALGLMKSGAICIAYETVTANNGSLPLLKPMSEVAGRMSVQVGAHYLEKEQGGAGCSWWRSRGCSGEGRDPRWRCLGRECRADGDWHARGRHHLRHQ